jgi:NPCBM-associated, NEW3 domain of alpha-galactosidase
MSQLRRFRAPAVLIAALAAILVFAATAAAETRTGEGAAAANPRIAPELDVVKAAATYEATTGSVGFTVTTLAAPLSEFEPGEEGEKSEAELSAVLASVPGTCTLASAEFDATYPLFEIGTDYSEPTAEALVFSDQVGGAPTLLGPAAKSVADVTTNLSFASGSIANNGFNCAVIFTEEDGSEPTYLTFPISVPPAAPAPVVAPAPAPPAPAPAALSIAKSKPLKLKAGKSKTVKIKVTNTGGTATGLGSLRVKAPAGVTVKPEKQRVPVLPPGASWTLSVRVQLTAKAKKSSTIALTGTAPGTTAKSSFVVKLLG